MFVPSNLKCGDVVAFSGATLVSDVVNLATYGVPRFGVSHVGIVMSTGGGALVIESTTLDPKPCAIRGSRVSGVQAHYLADYRDYPGKIWVYPLYRELYQHEEERATWFFSSQLGKPYDKLGALRSSGWLFAFIESLFHSQDLTTVYCSEMLMALYAHLGLVATNASQWNPNNAIRYLRRHGVLTRPVRLK